MIPKIDIGNLNHCIDDVAAVYKISEAEPDLSNIDQLIARLNAAKEFFPLIYRKYAIEPLIEFIEGRPDLSSEMSSKINKTVLSYVHAILQRAEGDMTTRAFQEIVDDLFVSFLSAEEAKSIDSGIKIKAPDLGIIPPMVRWNWNHESGPYINPNSIENSYGRLGIPWTAVPLVNLPIGFRQGGIAAWQSLGHETVGHGILSADLGLLDELKSAVIQQVSVEIMRQEPGMNKDLMSLLCLYWSFVVSEAAADVMGVLHLGPTAAIGLITFFRGRCKANAVAMGTKKYFWQMNKGLMEEPHPPTSWRIFMMAETVRLLKFSQADLWANVIEEEAMKDFGDFYLQMETGAYPKIFNKKPFMIEVAKSVARTMATHKLFTLEGHALIDIQCWSERDEGLKNDFMRFFNGEPPENIEEGCFAPYVLSAASELALRSTTGKDKIKSIFDRMVLLLSKMHETNPGWTIPLLHSDQVNSTQVGSATSMPTSLPVASSSGVVVSQSSPVGLRQYEGKYYRRIHHTREDTASAMHALLGNLNSTNGEYVIEVPAGGIQADIQTIAKQRYLAAVEPFAREGADYLRRSFIEAFKQRVVDTEKYIAFIAPFEERFEKLKKVILEIFVDSPEFFLKHQVEFEAIFKRINLFRQYEALLQVVHNRQEFAKRFFYEIFGMWQEFKNCRFEDPLWVDFVAYINEMKSVSATDMNPHFNQFVADHFKLYADRVLDQEAHLLSEELILLARLKRRDARVVYFQSDKEQPEMMNKQVQDNVIVIEQVGCYFYRLDPVDQVTAMGSGLGSSKPSSSLELALSRGRGSIRPIPVGSTGRGAPSRGPTTHSVRGGSSQQVPGYHADVLPLELRD